MKVSDADSAAQIFIRFFSKLKPGFHRPCKHKDQNFSIFVLELVLEGC